MLVRIESPSYSFDAWDTVDSVAAYNSIFIIKIFCSYS